MSEEKTNETATQTQSVAQENKLGNEVSAEVLLEVSKAEYENEKSRTSTIDSKANIVITLTSVFFVAITQAINLKKLFSVEVNRFQDSLLPAVLCLSILGALVMSVLSVVFILRVIFMQEYIRINAADFYRKDVLNADKKQVQILFSNRYIGATEHNARVNDQRAKAYQKGVIFLIVGIVLFVLHSCLISFI